MLMRDLARPLPASIASHIKEVMSYNMEEKSIE